MSTGDNVVDHATHRGLRPPGLVGPLLVLLLVLSACSTGGAPAFPVPEDDYSHLGLSDAEAATLLSLEQVDDYPLYMMRHYSTYDYQEYEGPSAAGPLSPVNVGGDQEQPWACTLFTAFADPDAALFGRNFDWSFSPTLLLFADPPDGYASAAMVNIAYLGFADDPTDDLTARPISELVNLLDAHHIPFDGLNEAGLTIGMAAVSPGQVPIDPNKDTIGSLGVIRAVLDKAATVDEAVEVLNSYNIDFVGGPPLHYLISDAEGDAALYEHYDGEVHVVRSETTWQVATNFLTAAVASPPGSGHSLRHGL